MNTHSLHHIIYTNAPGSDGSGYRFVKSPSLWASSKQLQPVLLWVESFELREKNNDLRGFATRCFRIAEQQYVCIAVAFADFAGDIYGRRGGILIHVLATPVKEGNDNGLHIVALMKKAVALQRPQVEDAQRLAIYLDKYTRNSTVEVAAPDAVELQKLGMDTLKNLLIVANVTTSGSIFHKPIPLKGKEPEFVLAYGAGALPPRLRLAFSWSFSRKNRLIVRGQPNFISTTNVYERFFIASNPEVEEYLLWLWDCLNNGKSALLNQLWMDWDIKSWKDLSLEKIRMYGNKKHEKNEFPTITKISEQFLPALPNEIMSSLQKEYEAMQEMLRDEINESINSKFANLESRLESLESRLNGLREVRTSMTKQPRLPPVVENSTPLATKNKGFAQSIRILKGFKSSNKFAVVGVVLLLLVIGIFIYPFNKETEQSSLPVLPEDSNSLSSPTPKDLSITTESVLVKLKEENSNSHDNALRNVIKNKDNKYYPALKKLMEEISKVEGELVSTTQKGRFKTFSESNKAFKRTEIPDIIFGAFEYIAITTACQEDNCGKVNLVLTDITNNMLTALNQKLPQSVNFDSVPQNINIENYKFKNDDKEFMAAVVLAHIVKSE